VATIADTLAQAKSLHRAGQLADALTLYRQVVAADSAHAEALYLLGATSHGLGDSQGAITNLTEAIRLQPTHPEAHNHLGAVLAEQGRFDEALAAIQQALRLRPGASEFADNLRMVSAAKEDAQGNDLAAQGMLAAAAACFRRVLELKPESAEAQSSLGAICERQGNVEEAAACYRRALELNPDYAEAHYNLGTLLQKQGKPDEAIACLRQALALKPGFLEASNNFWVLLGQQKAAADARGARHEGWGLRRMFSRVAERFLSAGERAALANFWTERTIAAHHRRGIRQIRREHLARPAKLNLGSGQFRKAGFLNVDLFPGGDLTLDIRRGLPFGSDCCELIFSEHCFEHFDYPEPVTHLLRECLRVLRPGGTLSFSVPDTTWPLKDYCDGPDSPYFKACEQYQWHPPDCTTPMEHINYHFRQGTEHRYAYDFQTAEKLLTIAGFVEIQRREFDPSLDAAHRSVGSLLVVARKPT
jgi:Flp pilus assembly protein TadD/predicted SAM-dependent methyltransferase